MLRQYSGSWSVVMFKYLLMQISSIPSSLTVEVNDPKRKEKKQKSGSSGFLAPIPLSGALVKFLGTGESALPRSDVIKRIWDYIKQHDLQVFPQISSINKSVVNFLTIHLLSLSLSLSISYIYFIVILVYWRTHLIRGEFCVMKSWKSSLMLKPSKDSQLQSSLLFTF